MMSDGVRRDKSEKETMYYSFPLKVLKVLKPSLLRCLFGGRVSHRFLFPFAFQMSRSSHSFHLGLVVRQGSHIPSHPSCVARPF